MDDFETEVYTKLMTPFYTSLPEEIKFEEISFKT